MSKKTQAVFGTMNGYIILGFLNASICFSSQKYFKKHIFRLNNIDCNMGENYD